MLVGIDAAHGAPTRLLDWTASPYVAAYFAVQHDDPNADGAVLCFCKNILEQRVKEGLGEEPPAFHAVNAPDWYEEKIVSLRGQAIVMPLEFAYPSSERIATQQGRFTMCFDVLAEHDCLIQQVLAPYARKFVIPQGTKAHFLLRLKEMNITGSALFPGVDGLGQSAKELVHLRAYLLKRGTQAASA